jgi:tetratricopeptide (TPR) repeat protein
MTAIAGGAVLVVCVVAWLVILDGQRKEAYADRALSAAMSAAAANNLPLASSELQKVISTYGGTPAAGQAVIMLNQIRLTSGQGELAITGLQDYLKTKPEPRFAVQAAGLLGSALENAKRPAEAAAAYLAASESAKDVYLKGEYLNQAARAYLNDGKPEEAIKLYRRVMSDFGKTPAVGEASVRLSELTKGAM